MKIGENPRKLCIFNPIPAVGGVGGLEITQKVFKVIKWSEAAVKIFILILLTHAAHSKPLSRSTQTYCLNALFYLSPTKSIFRPTFGHWISLLTKGSRLHNFLKEIFTKMPLKRICTFSVFLK